jgi:hypothetical protein
MIYVAAMRIMHLCVLRTKYPIVGLMQQHMRIVYSELDKNVLLFDIVS